MTDTATAVLVSWVSVGHQAAPLLTAIANPKSPLRDRVARLYLCWRDTPSPDGAPEREAFRETAKSLRAELGSMCPKIIKVRWQTAASPTDHAAIRPFAEEVLTKARAENPDALIAIHLSPGTPSMHAVWLVLGTTGFVPGPIELLQTADKRGQAAGHPPVKFLKFDLDTWLRRYRASRPRKAGDDDSGHMWDPARVKSPTLREALAKLQEWAPLRVPVLLVGERGTGKTTLANLLRSMSPYQTAKKRGWPAVVCGQFRVNPQLARSELFGHVRGAFTGATRDRQGLLEQADGETLFLDEIADIDGDTQRLLMAAVEGRGFQRLGDEKVRQSRFRLVCATNRPLADLRGGLLDRDFFDRIAVFVLSVPPLRQCTEDLPDAWRAVLVASTAASGIKPDGWEEFCDHPRLLAEISRHPLPGNFRDLQRAAYHLIAALHANRDEDQVIDAAVSGLGVPESDRHAIPSATDLAGELPLDDLRAQLEAYETAWLQAAMFKASGNKSEAARLLGLARKTFEHKLGKIGGDG